MSGLPFRFRVRNVLVRLHLVPVLTKGERHYGRGYSDALKIVDVAERDRTDIWSLLERLAEAKRRDLPELRYEADGLLQDRARFSAIAARDGRG